MQLEFGEPSEEDLSKKGNNVKERFNRVLFIGSKESGLKVFKKIYNIAPEKVIGCVTIDDCDDSRSCLAGFKEICRENKIELRISSREYSLAEAIETMKPDICIVMGWYYIIQKELIDKVKGGFIGIHNSLLPLHRGFAPVVWAMIAGDKETGFSVFSLDAGMDTGDIWYQEKVEILESDYVSDVLQKIDARIEHFFEEQYLKILYGKVKPWKQNLVKISYGAKRTEMDGKIDWSKSAYEIYNFIRAQSRPYPGAYTMYKGEKIILWNSRIFPYDIWGSPGQIGLIDVEQQEVIVVCGQNTGIVLRNIEINGKEIVAADHIKSLSLKLGDN